MGEDIDGKLMAVIRWCVKNANKNQNNDTHPMFM
jgi:hypothetical protein